MIFRDCASISDVVRAACSGFAAVALCCLVCSGCGGGSSYQAVPVTGKVTLNGQPLANVVVSFQPIDVQEGYKSGPGSTGVTAADGSYALKTVATQSEEGAVVGKHSVVLMESAPGGGDEDDSGSEVPQRLPQNARDGSLTIDVPESGTDQANFDF